MLDRCDYCGHICTPWAISKDKKIKCSDCYYVEKEKCKTPDLCKLIENNTQILCEVCFYD